MALSRYCLDTSAYSNFVWIAAAAARAGVPVVPYDGHFKFIRHVRAIILSPLS